MSRKEWKEAALRATQQVTQEYNSAAISTSEPALLLTFYTLRPYTTELGSRAGVKDKKWVRPSPILSSLLLYHKGNSMELGIHAGTQQW